jgi:cobalt-zinc-cadmium efflux system protein
VNLHDAESGLHHHHHHGGELSPDRPVWPFLVQSAVLEIFALVELSIGITAHSSALISDSSHMAIDVAIAIASARVIVLLRRPSNEVYTYGYSRADVIMGEFQGLAFIATASVTAWNGVVHLLNPSQVDGPLMVVAAAIGAVASLVLMVVLRRAEHSMTSETGVMHEIQDLSGFAATIAAGFAVWLTGWSRWDAIASFVVVIIMLIHGYRALKQSGRILLEAAPEGIDLEAIKSFIEEHEASPKVVNLHVWSINDDVATMTVHVRVENGVDCHALQLELDEFCRSNFPIQHTTIQTTHWPRANTGQN